MKPSAVFGCPVTGQGSPARDPSAFTLVEVMIVAATIALLATIAIPHFMRSGNLARGVRVSSDLRTFGGAFAVYSVDTGRYPADNHESLPVEMIGYIDPAVFNAPTAIGGRFNWDGPDFYPYAGVGVSSASLTRAQFEQVDNMVDNGDLNSGRYILPGNNRFTYIIE